MKRNQTLWQTKMKSENFHTEPYIFFLSLLCPHWGNMFWQFHVPRGPIARWQTAHTELTQFSYYSVKDSATALYWTENRATGLQMEPSWMKEISDLFYFIDLFPKKSGNNALEENIIVKGTFYPWCTCTPSISFLDRNLKVSIFCLRAFIDLANLEERRYYLLIISSN